MREKRKDRRYVVAEVGKDIRHSVVYRTFTDRGLADQCRKDLEKSTQRQLNVVEA